MKILNKLTWLHWLFGIAIGLITFGIAGVAWGYTSGVREKEMDLAVAIAVDVNAQYQLGLEDFEAGNYVLAKQRFDYVLQQYPDYPGILDMLEKTVIKLSEPSEPEVEVTAIIYPTPTLVTPSPTPTPDLRPLEEIFSSAEEQWHNQDWGNLIQTIVSLRDVDLLYHVGEVDRMLFLALRFNGIDKILNQGNLEGGIYDLALMEKFAPLDNQVLIYREWARLYMLGASFWGIFPEKSVYYFSQLASAAPYLRDFSGIYAKDRYRMALLDYADQLAKAGEWCLALEQFETAQSLVESEGLQPTLTFAQEQCLYGTAIPSEEELEATPTIEVFTSTPGHFFTSTPFPVTPTNTPGSTATSTPSPTTEAPEPTPIPSETPEPTSTPSPTEETTPQE